MTSLKELISNDTSGSSEILKRAIETINQSLDAGSRPIALLDDLTMLCNFHPSMVALSNLRKYLISKGISKGTIQSWFHTYQEHEESACQHFAAHLEQYDQVLVHSNSGLLLRSFQMMKRRIKIFCTESRPAFEGILLAQQLSRAGHNVTVTTDMGAFPLIRQMDALAFGCDGLTKRGIVNKIGTSALAFAARPIGKNTFFIATSEKFAENWEDTYLLRHGPGDQLYVGKEGISVQNFYFDLTPPEFVSGLFLEDGLRKDISL
jgi:translation initiation factor 2B subunit (eIF-2B alpha/beta/delta family)